MHFYSNPDFFFENWREGIQKQALRRVSQMDVLSVSSIITVFPQGLKKGGGGIWTDLPLVCACTFH